MGRRLPDEVVHRIRIRNEASEAVPAIAEAVKVGKKTIYILASIYCLAVSISATHNAETSCNIREYRTQSLRG